MSILDLQIGESRTFRPTPSSKTKKRPCNKQPQPHAATYILVYREGGAVTWACRACNWTLDADDDQPVEHRCERPQVVRAGTKLANALAEHGITPESVGEFLKKWHIPGGCGGCKSREEFLNRLDETFKLGEKVSAVKKFMGWG